MTDRKLPYRLSLILALLMALQSSLGLLRQDFYRDAEWIRTAWFGNDWFTLLLALPLLCLALLASHRGSRRGLLLWLGMAGYGVYNYAYYLFGAALNAFFPLYVAALVLASAVLILLLTGIDARQVAAGFREKTPVRLIGGFLVFTGVGLAAVWLGMWAAWIFYGKPLPVETPAFQVVAALDISLMVSLLVTGGVLLWRRKPAGYVIASLTGIQSSLYLLLLSSNSFLAVRRGLAESPGEVPVWGTLYALTAFFTLILILNSGGSDEPT